MRNWSWIWEYVTTVAAWSIEQQRSGCYTSLFWFGLIIKKIRVNQSNHQIRICTVTPHWTDQLLIKERCRAVARVRISQTMSGVTIRNESIMSTNEFSHNLWVVIFTHATAPIRNALMPHATVPENCHWDQDQNSEVSFQTVSRRCGSYLVVISEAFRPHTATTKIFIYFSCDNLFGISTDGHNRILSAILSSLR